MVTGHVWVVVSVGRVECFPAMVVHGAFTTEDAAELFAADVRGKSAYWDCEVTVQRADVHAPATAPSGNPDPGGLY